MPRPAKPDPMKNCEHCKKRLTRKRFNGTLEDMGAFLRRHFCDRACMAAAMEGVIKHATPKNSRRQSQKTAKAACEMCGRSKVRLHVHHRDENPLNNASRNLQTLCGSCHRRSHSRNWDATTGRRKACAHCSSDARQRGLCWTHLTRFKRYGDPLVKKIKLGSTWKLVRVGS